MNLDSISTGLANAAGAVSGLRTTTYVADQINPPTFVVGEYEIPEFHQSMQSGTALIKHTARLYVTRATDRSAQLQLATLIPSIREALEVDGTLGGAAQDLIVTSTGKAGVYTVAGTDYVGIDFYIDVYA